MTPEAKDRLVIDKKLVDASWILQDTKEFHPSTALGVAVRKFTTESDPADYLLFVDKVLVASEEATVNRKI